MWISGGPPQVLPESTSIRLSMDKLSQRGWISHVPGGGKPQQGMLFPFSDHSLSQRGMGWCHVPSAWQTAVKDTSFSSPYMGEKNSCGLYRAFNSFPTLKFYSACPSFHCCPIFAPLQSVPVAISSCLPSIPYLPQATHSSWQAKTPAASNYKTMMSQRCYPALAIGWQGRQVASSAFIFWFHILPKGCSCLPIFPGIFVFTLLPGLHERVTA